MVLVQKNTHPNSKIQKKKSSQIKELGTTNELKNSDVDNQRLKREKRRILAKKGQKRLFHKKLGLMDCKVFRVLPSLKPL
jgi:hypothetical protein